MPNFLVTTIKTTVNRIDYLIEDCEDEDDAGEAWNSYDTGFDIHKYEEDWSEGSEEVETIWEISDDFDLDTYTKSNNPDQYLSNHLNGIDKQKMFPEQG